MSTSSLGSAPTAWRIEIAPTYRQHIAAGVLAAILAYVLIVYPLGYYGQFVAADSSGFAPVQTVEPSLLNRLFFPLVAGLGLLMLWLERGRVQRLHLLPALPFLLFWLYCGTSALWSLDPGTTIAKFLSLSLVVIATLPAVATIDSADRFHRPMYWIVVATLLINLAFVLLTPPTPIGHAGIYSHKNSLGSTAAFCSMFLIYGFAQPRRLYRVVSLLLVPVALYILWRSQAKTSLGLAFIAPTIGAILVFGRYYFRLPIGFVLAFGVGLAWFVLFSGVFDIAPSDISMVITGDPTFTGRTDLWTFAVQKIAERPWFGWGFKAFWQVGDKSPAWEAAPGFVQRTPHAHEGYLDLLLQGGIVGFGLFFAAFQTTTSRVTHAIDEAPLLGWLMASILVFEALTNLLETAWLDPLDPGTVIFISYVGLALSGRAIRRPEVLLRTAQ